MGKTGMATPGSLKNNRGSSYVNAFDDSKETQTWWTTLWPGVKRGTRRTRSHFKGLKKLERQSISPNKNITINCSEPQILLLPFWLTCKDLNRLPGTLKMFDKDRLWTRETSQESPGFKPDGFH